MCFTVLALGLLALSLADPVPAASCLLVHSQVFSLCVPTHEGAKIILGHHKDSNPNTELYLSDLMASSRLLSASPMGEDFMTPRLWPELLTSKS